ncbi:transcription factor bHLH93-like [Pistacia vera]|uniref:transcription factor bHLH93-like n=1 Tax=Pistacia vera TaxID=55513 RepID=UPI0012639896|nr:transcription factor bHLH93-like [Pistacia vera]
MEFSEHGFLEELLALRRDTWETIPTEMDGLFSSNWSYGCYDQSPAPILPNSYYQAFSAPLEQDFNYNNNFNEVYCPFVDELSAPQLTDSSINTLDTPPFPIPEEFPLSIMDDEEPNNLLVENFQNLDVQSSSSCKVEPFQESPEIPVFNMGTCLERKNRNKKSEGQPSKNLMAERRRRKRLNDRLSMLRSIVPKISKMDRTSILGDTIDYMKELLEKINNLQQEIEADSTHMETVGICKDVKPNESLVRNTPKFGVERRNMDTRIEICCAGKPGLLLSTVSTLEALGLEIEQCVISCFNDFSVQASCSEETEQRTLISSEDIKQALFRNAGYGGRCL